MTETENSEELIRLGGNIELSGFNNIKDINNVVLNKIIGNHVKKCEDVSENFESLHLRLKSIHGDNGKMELHAKAIDNGSVYTSEIVDRNLYFALDTVLKKIKAEIEHKNSSVSAYLTVSIGLYLININKTDDVNVIYNIADKCLYKAKNNGRNQVYTQVS